MNFDPISYAMGAKSAGGSGSNVFVVTFTPTATDFSGTKNKTNAEIYEAWLSGKQIWAAIVNNDGEVFVPLSSVTGSGDYSEYTPKFNFDFVFTGIDGLIHAYTGNDPQGLTYGTAIYALNRFS